MAETTAEIARAHPDIDYRGIEVHSPGVGAVLKRLPELDLTNVRIIQHDAVEVAEHLLATDTLDGVHIFVLVAGPTLGVDGHLLPRRSQNRQRSPPPTTVGFPQAPFPHAAERFFRPVAQSETSA